ncbi:MAG: 30S ribosomal protein S12 methylthiotransferase RimO [Proteobacteria bacterium]|nr:30S ribosomal protein S12 methylthiotransferase RimO [Pseudomonadota bacterium]MBU1647728.1 30S ribosomal protein S12 methylthiotransferase RimO [Pseudomonadota bacterium]
MASFHLISLGCPKNLVDSELMFGLLEQAGWAFEEDPEQASMLLINTCGFIQSAVEEAIEEILELTLLKQDDPDKLLVVTGCMVQRYREELLHELPEVDLFIGTEGCHQIVSLVAALIAGELKNKVVIAERFLMDSTMPRRISTPFYRSWLKITEGCNNRCSYCMIPSIRGDLRSRPIADLVTEAGHLEQKGVRELSLIAQDLTAYGDDLADSVHLPALLKSLLAESSIPWIRLMYLYPSGINDALLSLMAEEPRIVPYMDIPFQHVSDTVLKRMNRHYASDDLYQLIGRVRAFLPNVALRTTLMVGFPGETDDDVRQLEQFLREAHLDHVGVFAYANETGCPSENFSHQCSEGEKSDRLDFILGVQAEVSATNLQKYVGRVEPVLVEGVSRETDLLLEGRTRFQAPDIDGCVYISDGTANPGDIVQVRINEAQVYDLVGEIIY